MPELPLEVWQHITSFLHDTEIWQLREVNSVLFQLAMDTRYHSVCISFERLKSSMQYSSSVQSLEYVSCQLSSISDTHNTIVGFNYASRPPGKAGNLAWTAQKQSKPYSSNVLSLTFRGITSWYRINTVKSVIARFTGVTTLIIGSNHFATISCLDYGLPLIRQALSVLQEQLLTLSIAGIPLGTIVDLLAPFTFPRCDSIAVWYTGTTPASDSSEALLVDSDLSPFLNRHCNTLRVFSFHSTGIAPANIRGATNTLKSLQHMPHLVHLDVSPTDVDDPILSFRERPDDYAFTPPYHISKS